MYIQTGSIVILALITSILSCSTKKKDDPPIPPHPLKFPEGIWDKTDFYRHLSSWECECGTSPNELNKDKSWNLYVHSKISSNTLKTCTATLIASNLIITSHKCLTLEGKEGSRNMVDKNDVIVTNKVDEKDPTAKRYNIKEIILNTRNTHYPAQIKLPVNDILIIVLHEDLLAFHAHVPICVPWDYQSLNVLKHSANYYGVGKKGSADPLVEIRSQLVIHGGGAADGRCEENDGEQKNETAINSTFCVVYFSDAPSVEGGPLIVYSNAERPLPYLVGIATKVGVPKTNSQIDFDAYFSDVIASTKYLEYHARLQKSLWCTAPELKLRNASQVDDDGRPWEELRSIGRDESLNCVCGQRNTKQARNTKQDSGIDGGVEANPYEFGWMTVLIVTTDIGQYMCGGSLINDRMILTAAHCVINDTKVKRPNSQTRQFLISPKDVQVGLYAHKTNGDAIAITKTVASILFHPDYVVPRRQEYFDYDIALLILKEPLKFHWEFTRGINPICLPKLGISLPIIGKMATVAGWGLKSPRDRYSPSKVLRKVEAPISQRNVCSIATKPITERFICAGTLNMMKDAAKSDSGGALMIQNDKEQFIEVGILSWGEDVTLPTGEVKTATLYTDVQGILSFINYHAHRVQAKWCKSSPPE